MSEKKFTIAIISWRDAAIHGRNQVTETDTKDYGLMEGYSVGVIVNETKEFITLATDFFPSQKDNEENTYRCLNSIPKGCIYRIRRIKAP